MTSPIDRINLASIPPARVRLLGVVLTLAIVVSSVGFLLSSWFGRRAATERIAERLALVSLEHGRLSDARVALIERIESTRERVDSAPIPERPRTMNALAARMALIADELGLKTQRMGPDRAGPKDGAYPINAGFIGSYALIELWLDRVHDKLHDLHVERIELTPGDAESRSLRVTMRLIWYKPDDPTPDAD